MGRRPVPLPLLEAGLVVAWSSGFIGAKLAAETPSIFLVLFWRFAILSVLLAPFVIRVVRRDMGWRRIGLHLLLGALAMFGYLAAGIKAIDLGVPAGLAALVCALQPLATAGLAGLVLGEPVRRRQWAGLALGFAGVAVAVEGAVGSAPFWAYGLVLLGMASLVVATLVAKAMVDPTPLLPSLGIQSAVSAALFAPLAVVEGGILPLADPKFLLAVAWFILFSTLGGYGLYWLCLKHGTARPRASRASSISRRPSP